MDECQPLIGGVLCSMSVAYQLIDQPDKASPSQTFATSSATYQAQVKRSPRHPPHVKPK